MGRRCQMETTAQQPLPLAHPGAGGRGGPRRVSWGACNERLVSAANDSDSDESLHGSRRSKRNDEEEGSSPTRRRREHQGDEEVGAKMTSSLGPRGWGGQREGGKHRSPPKRAVAVPVTVEANAEASRRSGGRSGEASNRREGRRCVGGSGTGAGAGAGAGVGVGGRGKGELASTLVSEEQGAIFPPSLSSGLRPDSFDYLSAEDIRPSPNPSQELQRAVSSLPRADWPEIFHTLNSVRRLATHHARLLSSEPNLHALVRDVLSQAENLRSQVAKNALLSLADLWRGLGDALDPELPMLCPVLVKKMADKVEFLAEAARECVDEIIANASEARVLSAFLSCGNHRSPVVRAKSALAILLCVRQRYTDADTRGGRGSDGKGVGRGVMVPREIDRVLATLPRFLQDGNQETRIHARTLAGLLLETGEVDEARLRRELPPPTMKRLQRDLFNSSLPSGIGFATFPSATAPASTGRSNSTRRLGQGSTRCGYARSAGSVSSPSRLSFSSGGGEEEGSCRERGFGGVLRDNAGRRDVWIEGKWQRDERGAGVASGGDRMEEKDLVSTTRTVMRRRSSRLRPDEKVGASRSGGEVGSTPSPLEGAARQSTRRSKVSHFREAECLPEIHSRLDSGDWRERMYGLKNATALLEEHGEDINTTGKNRLLDRIAELLSDGNLKVNILALESVARLASSSGTKLDPAVNTLAPAVCKNLASSNQQRVALAEEALDALCDAVDPCLLVQPVTSLAQYGNIRLKVPMLTLLRDLAPAVGDTKPILLKKYVRPAALSLVRENRSNIRDAALSLLRAVEVALDPMYPKGGAAAAAAVVVAAAEEFAGHGRRDDGGMGRNNNNAQPPHRTFTPSSDGKYSYYGGGASLSSSSPPGVVGRFSTANHSR